MQKKTVLNLDEKQKVIQKINWVDKLETPCSLHFWYSYF